MAYQDIEDRYKKSYEASKSTLDAGNKAKLADLQNQELEMKNRYSQLLDTINKNRAAGQEQFYSQKNQADVIQNQNAEKMNQLAASRGWTGGELAQINLDQSAQRANALGAINTQQNKYMSDMDTQRINAERDNQVALNQLMNNRNLAGEQYRLGLYGLQQENEAKKLAEIYNAMQQQKQNEWEAQQAALERVFKDQQQAAQLANQKDIANMEYNYKNTQTQKTQEQDQLKAINDYYDNMLKRFDDMAKMNMKEYKTTRGEVVNKDIDIPTKQFIYNSIQKDTNLTNQQRQELMARYNLNKDLYLLQPQSLQISPLPMQQQQVKQVNSGATGLWNDILKNILPWWNR